MNKVRCCHATPLCRKRQRTANTSGQSDFQSTNLSAEGEEIFSPSPNNSNRKVVRKGRIRATGGVNQQTTPKFHGILNKPLSSKDCRLILTSQIYSPFGVGFLEPLNPMESTIFSSEKSYSPLKLK